MVKLSDAESFRKLRLQELKLEPFATLAKLPNRQRLQIPPSLRGLNIYQCKKNGEHDGLEITVRVEQRVLLIFAAVSEDGFEIFPDGRIIDLYDGEYDPDD
jgi:hypothetical protein